MEKPLLLCEIKHHDLSIWTDWIKNELPAGGLSFSGDDTAFLSVTRAVQMADRIKKLSGHLPTELNVRLVQAAIIYQFWNGKRQTTISLPQDKSLELEILKASEYLKRLSDHCSLMQTPDGRFWEVSYHRSDREMNLASEVIATSIAQLMGLPNPGLSLTSVDRQLAAKSGMAMKGWP